jgi:uncharacterized protein (TIRG00374 family)
MRASYKIAFGLTLSLLFLYLTIFSPHVRAALNGTERMGEALFGHPRFALADLAAVIRSADLRYILLTGVLFVATLLIRAWRWRLMLNPLVRMSFKDVFGAMCIGYMSNNILPLRMGELYRAQVVYQLSGLSRSAAFGSVVLERLIDLVFMTPYIGLALLMFPLPGAIQTAAYLAAGGSFVITGLFVWLVLDRTRALGAVERFSRVIPEKPRTVVLNLIHRFTDGLAILGRKETLLELIVSSLGLWAMYSAMVYLVMKSVGLVEPEFPLIYDNPLAATLVTLVFTTFGFVLPGAPGAVGTYHGVAVLGLSLFDVAGDRAVGFAVLLHALNYIPLTVLGLFFFWKNGLSFGERKQISAELTRTVSTSLDGAKLVERKRDRESEQVSDA